MAEEKVAKTFTVFTDSAAVVRTSASNLLYLFRYNIVNKEGSSLTAWSPINHLEQDNVGEVLNTFTPTYSISSVESAGRGINLKWTLPEGFVIKKMDVYFSWSYDSGASTFTPYEYADTVTSSSYYIDIPFNESSIKAKFVKAIVQLPTNIKIINDNAKIFESEVETTLPILDSGSIS